MFLNRARFILEYLLSSDTPDEFLKNTKKIYKEEINNNKYSHKLLVEAKIQNGAE